MYDEYSKEDIETLLDKIKFFTDVELGLKMSDFVLQENHLSQLFLPVATFHN
jgi:hypothetical protein